MKTPRKHKLEVIANMRMCLRFIALFSLSLCVGSIALSGCSSTQSAPISVLIVDGQNNHTVWPKSTQLMKQALEANGKFTVDVYRTLTTWKLGQHAKEFGLKDGKKYIDLSKAKSDPSFSPDFEQYDVVISNFGWKAAPWPKATEQAFEKYMKQGGGFVSVHAADNSFPHWIEYNKMIGLGGWGGRDHNSGPYVYFDEQGNETYNLSEGIAGQHGEQHAFDIQIREPNHPITQALPQHWLHVKDELYGMLRGPAQDMTILATAFNDKSIGGSGRHEPVAMVINYHQGRVFHTTLGHNEAVYRDTHFINLLTKGTEWAATGNVTQQPLTKN